MALEDVTEHARWGACIRTYRSFTLALPLMAAFPAIQSSR